MQALITIRDGRAVRGELTLDSMVADDAMPDEAALAAALADEAEPPAASIYHYPPHHRGGVLPRAAHRLP